jgi:periplasmic divalent cation tolerance protein
MSSKVSLGYCTFPSEESAQKICRQLVDEGLIACANILPPGRSIYKWQGEVKVETEWTAILKTSSAKRAKLRERVLGLHPYQIPCLVFVAVDDGSPEFLRWVCSQAL